MVLREVYISPLISLRFMLYSYRKQCISHIGYSSLQYSFRIIQSNQCIRSHTSNLGGRSVANLGFKARILLALLWASLHLDGATPFDPRRESRVPSVLEKEGAEIPPTPRGFLDHNSPMKAGCALLCFYNQDFFSENAWRATSLASCAPCFCFLRFVLRT